MYIPRLLILPLLISVCVAAQPVPGNIRKLGKRYICIEPGPVAEPPAWIKNLFPRPVLLQQVPTTAFRPEGGIPKHIIPPPEFRVHDFTIVDASRVGLLAPRWRLCDGINVYVDEKGRIH
jgi:hypothetical protein